MAKLRLLLKNFKETLKILSIRSVIKITQRQSQKQYPPVDLGEELSKGL